MNLKHIPEVKKEGEDHLNKLKKFIKKMIKLIVIGIAITLYINLRYN